MATRLRGTLVDGLNKPIVNATVALLAKGNSLLVLSGSEAIFKTSATGTYDITVQTGYYKVIIGPQGSEPYKAGEIAIYADSKEGTLNNYLTSWAPEELTPEVIAQVKDLVSQAETAKNASASSATKSEQERVKAEAAAKKAEDTANGMKASIGLTNNPRDCPDISGNPSSFLGFLRIMESAIGWPSVASGERYLSGFICPTLGSDPTFTGLFIGYLTGSTYTYKWNPSSGPLWYKHIKSSEIDRYSQLSDSTAIYNASKSASLVIKDTKTWGAWDNQTSKYIPLAIAQGGTGGVTDADARTNLGLGRSSSPTFGHLNLLVESDSALASSGMINQYLRNTNGTQRARSRIYSEIRGDNKAWLTLHLQSDAATNKYAGLSIDGNFQINGSFIGSALSLTDVATSKVNLQINRFVQNTGETDVVNHAATAQIFITDNKNWGAYDKELKRHIPLPVSQGGTGAVTIGDAKTNLQIPSVGAGDWLEIAAPSGVEAGKYYPIVIKAQYASLYASGFFIDIQTRSSSGSDPMNCCTFNGFIRTGGWSDRKDAGYGYYNRYGSNELALKCILVSAKNAEDNIAVYVEGRAFPVKMRIPQFCTATAVASASTYGEVTFAWGTSNPATDSVGVNTLFDFSLNRVGFYQASTVGNYYIGNGQRIVLSNGMSVGDELSLTTPKITFSGTVAAGNGFIADGTSVSNATFYSRYRVGDTIYGAEFRASENAAQVIVRDPTGTNHQFFNFNLNGSFSPPNGLLSSTGVDWNSQINTVNKFYGIAGQVNTPENNVVYGGIHVGFSGNYAFQICGRNGKSFFRTVEAGQEGQWNRLLVKNDYGVGSVAENLPNDASSGFYSDSKAISWAPGSGAGFQSSYDANRIWQFWLNQQSQALFRYNDSGNAQASKTDRPWTTLQAAGTSDINFKRVHGEMDTDVALDNISKLEFVYFNYLSDGPERDIRRGIIAQQAQEVDPEYVHSAETSGKMTLDSNPLLLDALAAIQSLKKKDQDNKDRISKLETEVEELKTLVATLVNKEQPLP
ncbi:lateral tail fiber protein [Escherichia phage SeppeHuegi]|nr:lateral tail fiber protein [Escherichia phage SeppeHuegi]